MQGLSDGYFVLPYTLQNYLADQIQVPHISIESPEFEQAERQVRAQIARLQAVKGDATVDSFHRRLGKIMWEYVGMARHKAGLEKAITLIRALREEFWQHVKVAETPSGVNAELEKALRVADFLELGELMARDALQREESCGGHFRTEHQTDEGEAQRDDAHFNFVAAYEYKGEYEMPELHKEQLDFEFVELKQRNYK
ncbi:MAG: fumarate reductase/succinate dehydrogenase flavoprotein subunit, partial [Bacteroidales bacterium]|nr:fumarate reductase/succinate dehydrogenase flavoprotein subunit [Bacteroidales bacterium]